MKLVRVHVKGYRSLADFELEVRPLNVLIGANAAGKSTVLDVLAFLREAVTEGSFGPAVRRRAGLSNLMWMGEGSTELSIRTEFRHEGDVFTWSVDLKPDSSEETSLDELLLVRRPPGGDEVVLTTLAGRGTWLMGQREVPLDYASATCGIAAASVNAEFRGREVASFVRSWSFFDPHPASLRVGARIDEADRLVMDGGNLGARLYRLSRDEPDRYERILTATRAILGFPRSLRFAFSNANKDWVWFEQEEEGLRLGVHQLGASSGTLRLLALVTALLGTSTPSVIGIEEPENHLHPQAIDGFVQLVQRASETHQILITTHWPGFLDGLEDPSAVCVVRRDEHGTRAERPRDPELIREALRESGFGLGEYFATTGFGA